jgi:hypothetical protein
MTQFEIAEANRSAADVPPEAIPLFGAVPEEPFEASPEQLVLSLSEHTHLSATGGLLEFSGPFSASELGRGTFSVRLTGGGMAHVHADVVRDSGPAVHLDADVRESWVLRAASQAQGADAGQNVVHELLRLVQLPRQSTVRLSLDEA